MLHASHNLFVQAIFDRMTAPAGRARYITTGFGFGMVLTVAATALYFWTRRSMVESSPVAPAPPNPAGSGSAGPREACRREHRVSILSGERGQRRKSRGVIPLEAG